LFTNGHNIKSQPIIGNHHENTTYNRLIKQSLHYLKNDQTDVVILHDPCMPYIDEKVIFFFYSLWIQGGSNILLYIKRWLVY